MIILLYTIFAIIFLPIFVTLASKKSRLRITYGVTKLEYFSVLDFKNDSQFSSNIEFDTKRNMTFPNITVCHSRYFDRGRMQGRVKPIVWIVLILPNNSVFPTKEYGVGDDLADYMTMVLDMGYGQQFITMTEDKVYGNEFALETNRSEAELRRVLNENNFDLLELFEALAVR